MFLKGTPNGVSIQSFINLGKPFFPISRPDLILGKGFCIFICFHFPFSPSVLNGLHFYFSLCDSASREYLQAACRVHFNALLSPK